MHYLNITVFGFLRSLLVFLLMHTFLHRCDQMCMTFYILLGPFWSSHLFLTSCGPLRATEFIAGSYEILRAIEFIAGSYEILSLHTHSGNSPLRLDSITMCVQMASVSCIPKS